MTTETEPSKCTYEDICTFCSEVRGEASMFLDLGVAASRDEYVLAETERFVVVPCVGALTDWYVLVVPKRHALSVGWLEPAERAELRELVADVRSRLAAVSGLPVVLFEHGTLDFRDKGGACHDHAHVHLLAVGRPVEQFVAAASEHVPFVPCDDWIEETARYVREVHRSYLIVDDGERSLIAAAPALPSQFFRRTLASWLLAEEGAADWLVFPQADRLRAMIARGLAPEPATYVGRQR